jgi:O-acetyl-ADP-ribose deacetylase (regulator of RNase III)
MIRFTRGNLLDAPVEALVNTVNTVGVMGKGIALAFKLRFPENFEAYAKACRAGIVQTGHMFVHEDGDLSGPRWIINFPTKKHWRDPTRIEWIVSGLADLKLVLRAKGIRSVAIPALGCGNGGLAWTDVRPLIERALSEVNDVEIHIFEPAGMAPSS